MPSGFGMMMKLPTDSTKVRDCTSLHHLMLPSLSVRYPSQAAIQACSRANSSVMLQCRELCEGPWTSEPIVSKILPSRCSWRKTSQQPDLMTDSFWALTFFLLMVLWLVPCANTCCTRTILQNTCVIWNGTFWLWNHLGLRSEGTLSVLQFRHPGC